MEKIGWNQWDNFIQIVVLLFHMFGEWWQRKEETSPRKKKSNEIRSDMHIHHTYETFFGMDILPKKTKSSGFSCICFSCWYFFLLSHPSSMPFNHSRFEWSKCYCAVYENRLCFSWFFFNFTFFHGERKKVNYFLVDCSVANWCIIAKYYFSLLL